MDKADDAADEEGNLSPLQIHDLPYETKMFLLARWLDTG